MRVALYARVSSEKQAEKDLSIPAQLKALRDYALKRSWDIQAEYVDEAESARSADRPKFQEMIGAAKQKPALFNAILVWKLSRFARNREDSILYKSLLKKHGVDVVSINEQIDNTPSGQLLEGIIEVIDEFYSANLSHDTIRGMKENARRGFLNSSTPPYGYKRIKIKVGNVDKAKLDIEPAHAPVVKRIFKMCLDGKGAKEICKALNDSGLKTRKGRSWETNAIHYMLRNETYTGVLIYNRVHKNSVTAIQRPEEETIRFENAHPAIIDAATFKLAQELITKRSPKYVHPRTISSPYLLSGFLHCGECGASMAGCAAKNSRFFYYTCHNRIRRGDHGCKSRLVKKERLEKTVIEQLKKRILTEDNLRQLVGLVNEELHDSSTGAAERLLDVDAQLELVREKLGRLYAALESGKLEFADLAPRIKELRSQIETLERAKLELSASRSQEQIRVSDSEIRRYVVDLRGLLESSTVLESKAFLRSWIKRIDLDRPEGGTIHYVLPLNALGASPEKEVLSLRQTGVADGI